jgi:hypothetical protein
VNKIFEYNAYVLIVHCIVLSFSMKVATCVALFDLLRNQCCLGHSIR